MAKKKEDMTAENVVKKEKKKNPALRLIIFLVELILIIVGIAGSYTLIKKYNNPKLVAENYYNALLAGDYEKAYSYLDLEEETVFLTQETFAAAMESTGIADSKHYSIEEGTSNTYYLEYDDEYMSIKLYEQEDKRYFVFKDYEIVPEDIYAKEVTFVAPRGLTVSLNGIVLDSSNSKIDSSDYYLSAYETSYTVDKMFAGTYLMEVSGDNYQTYTEQINISIYTSLQYVETPYLVEGLAQEMAERAYNDLTVIYQSAMNGEDTCSVLEAAKAYDFVDVDDFDYYYNSLRDSHLAIDDGFFEYMTMSDLQSEIHYCSYDYETGYFQMAVDIEFYEEYGYQQLDWWTEAYYDAYTDSARGYAVLYYTYVDGEWILDDLIIGDGIYIW